MRGVKLAVALLLGSVAQPTLAAWHKASSKHFVIYADERPERLQAFATKLEKFDKAVRLARSMPDYEFGDGNRLTIFVVRNVGAVEKLAGTRNIGGFYVGRATGPLAVVPKIGFSDSNEDFSSDIIFFHEYAHHLMMQDLEQALPEWLIEGFAEMMSTAKFEKDGGMWLGRAAQHRAEGLFWGESMALETLLAGNYGAISDGLRESIYGRGWLLTHYLNFEPSRRGQLNKYVTLLAQGIDPLEAARTAFGDLKRLDQDLTRYRLQRRINALRISASSLVPPPVDIRPLSAGAAGVLPLRLQSKLGVDATTAEPLAIKVRAVQAKHRGDALVEVTLAEAELDAGHPQASEAAADRALAADPRNTEAMIYKGRAIAARALASTKPDAKLVADARAWFTKANKADPEDPEPLMEYFKSFVEAREAPTKNAIDALHYASNLAPQDTELRLNSALQYLSDKDLKKARKALAPIAYNPHGRQVAAIARAMMKRIEAGDAEGALKLALTPAKSEGTADAGK
jgi:hypothetical protein